MRTGRRSRSLSTLAVLIGLMVATSDAQSSNRRPTDEERGEELYQRHCVQCHGAQVDGQGPASKALIQPVPDLRGQVKTDRDAEQLVLYGKQTMPGFLRSFGGSDARRVLRYMKDLSEGKVPEKVEPEDPELEAKTGPDGKPIRDRKTLERLQRSNRARDGRKPEPIELRGKASRPVPKAPEQTKDEIADEE